jgi:Fuc2NAc and GlcNAc transferase
MSELAVLALLVCLAGVGGWALTGAVRAYSLARGMLDVPNHRSSHTAPTPRGGGVAIVTMVVAGMAVAWALGLVPARTGVALGGGGLAVAAIGWLDDRRSLSPLTRASVQFLAAGWAVFWLRGLPHLEVGFTLLDLDWIGPLLGVLGLVWLTNLYNFMDGIDGLAAGEALAVGVVGGALLWWGGEPGLAALAFLVAAASAGFLAWNWQPARIFMGDVGSGFLGFVFAGLALASENARALPLLIWVLILGVFVLDATLTLLRRVRRGERWSEAHRSHAYQRAVQSGWTHAQVTGGIMATNAVLAVIATAAWFQPSLILPCVAGGFLLLALLYGWVERRHPMAPSSAGSGS